MVEELRALGVQTGEAVLIVAADLDAAELTAALSRAVGRRGTLLAPQFGSGAAASASVLGRRGARSSGHPLLPFVASGPEAAFLTRDAPLQYPLGAGSPLERLHQIDGRILLAGADHASNPALHLAEHWADMPYARRAETVWTGEQLAEIHGIPGCSRGFTRIDPILRQARIQREVTVAGVALRVMRIRQAVSMAMAMLQGDPESLLCPDEACPHCTLARKQVAEQLR